MIWMREDRSGPSSRCRPGNSRATRQHIFLVPTSRMTTVRSLPEYLRALVRNIIPRLRRSFRFRRRFTLVAISAKAEVYTPRNPRAGGDPVLRRLSALLDPRLRGDFG